MDEPAELLPKAWRMWVLDEKGRVQRTRLELGLWFVARDALRAGRLFRPVGRRYADPAAFLMPDERWQADRRELAITFGRTLDADQRLRELQAEQHQAMRSLQAAVDAGDGVRLVAGRLDFSPPDRSRRARPPCGSGLTWIASHRTSTSPTCSPRSKGGPGSPASSRTPRARHHASAIFSSICTRRCSPQG